MQPSGLAPPRESIRALDNWKDLQEKYDCFFFVADWHALSTNYADTSRIREYARELLIDWLAAGIDPDRATVFIQSSRPGPCHSPSLAVDDDPIPGSNATRRTRKNRRRSKSGTSRPTGFSAIRCCRPPISSSTRPILCRWAKINCRIWN